MRYRSFKNKNKKTRKRKNKNKNKNKTRKRKNNNKQKKRKKRNKNKKTRKRRINKILTTKLKTYSKKDYESTDGMLTSVWGPSLWHTLHTISFNYPIYPSKEDKKNYKKFMIGLKNVLPL